MSSLPQSLYRAEQVRELDRLAIEEYGIPGYTLMSRAGSAAFNVLQQYWPQARRIIVFCGTGNNGGDGFVLARLAKEAGLDPLVIQLGEADTIHGDALQAYKDWSAAAGQSYSFDAQAMDYLAEADVIVDALLGTGLERQLEGNWRMAVEAMNDAAAPVLAIDIPSGLHSDSGSVLGVATHAEITVTFIGLKQGMFTGEAPDYCGQILFDDLGVPPEIYLSVPQSVIRLDGEMLDVLLPRRKRTSHKGHFGHVLVVGGDKGMMGAVRMAAEASARAGAGLVSVATRADHAANVASVRPELMCHGIEHAADLLSLMEKADVIAIGPGLGQSPWAQELLSAVLDSSKPLVVDADALNLLAKEPMVRNNWILTPHPGEAARLLKTTNAFVQEDRFNTLDALVDAFGGVCVLKGAGTLIGSMDNTMYVCDKGNPGMASGGMGDVLTGIIAAMLAQGLDLEEAACAGVFIHSSAADAAATEGERGMLASDLLHELRWLVNPSSFDA